MPIPRVALAIFALAAIASHAQKSESPSFEAATVKPTPASERAGAFKMRGGPQSSTPGEFYASNITLRLLMQRAYGFRPQDANRIAGPPALDRNKYDVVAKIPVGATMDQFLQMLQNLLADGFGMALHWEDRDLPIYELSVAKGGPKLKEAEESPAATAIGDAKEEAPALDKRGLPILPPGIPAIRGGMWARSPDGSAMLMYERARMQSISSLIRALQGQLDRPVVDKTGLTGTYDFALDYQSQIMNPDPNARPQPASLQEAAEEVWHEGYPDVSGALESQLGLKLAAVKGPIKVVVVDKVNPEPIEN